MGLSLASPCLFPPENAGNRSHPRASSDCNVPLRSSKTSPFVDMNDLLEAVNSKPGTRTTRATGSSIALVKSRGPTPR